MESDAADLKTVASSEVLEDLALSKAIAEGLPTPEISRDEVFAVILRV